MNKFLKKLTAFILFFAIFFLLVFFVSNTIIKINSDFTTAKGVNSLIIGHSHPECALDDKIVKNCINMSSSGTSYFYNFYLLKPILKFNKNIKTVYIEYTNNQIDSYMDNWIWGNSFVPSRVQKFGTYIDSDGFLLLFFKNPASLFKGFSLLIKQQIKVILTSNYSYFYQKEGFLSLKESYLSKSVKEQIN